MAEYFQNPEDLRKWVKSRGSVENAAKELVSVMGEETLPENNEVLETCRSIFENDDEDDDYASQILFGVLAKHNLTKAMKKHAEGVEMKKEAQDSRQRNGWVRGRRNKWNRTVEGFNEGTPWRVDRDKMYDKTHYYTDLIKFDEDPNHLYSSEAIWRMYVMDKFYRDYKDKNGRVVGGYLNDRFQVWHDVGGNQMELADGERTRKPRPHQYSTERRLEEARGNKTEDLKAHANTKGPMVKISSNIPKEREDDKVYQIFRDILDMREAGVEYKKIITATAEHYNTTVLKVAEIDAFAKKVLKNHNGISYTSDGISSAAQVNGGMPGMSGVEFVEGLDLVISSDLGAEVKDQNGQIHMLPAGTVITQDVDGGVPVTLVSDTEVVSESGQSSVLKAGSVVAEATQIQDAADEVGLNEETLEEYAQGDYNVAGQPEDFDLTEMPPNR